MGAATPSRHQLLNPHNPDRKLRCAVRMHATLTTRVLHSLLGQQHSGGRTASTAARPPRVRGHARGVCAVALPTCRHLPAPLLSPLAIHCLVTTIITTMVTPASAPACRRRALESVRGRKQWGLRGFGAPDLLCLPIVGLPALKSRAARAAVRALSNDSLMLGLQCVFEQYCLWQSGASKVCGEPVPCIPHVRVHT